MVLFETIVQNDLRKLRVVLQHWRDGVRKELLPALADRILEQTRHRVKVTKQTPDGKRWSPRKSKKLRHGLLTKTRSMLRSIKKIREGKDEYQIGSAMERSLFHQEGTRHMTSRQFVGVGKRDEDDIDNAIDGWVARFGSRTRALARELR